LPTASPNQLGRAIAVSEPGSWGSGAIAGVLVLITFVYNGKMDEERGRRANGRGGASGLVVGLLVVIVILLVLVLLTQLGLFSVLFGGSNQQQAPQNQPNQASPQNQPDQQAPKDQQPKQEKQQAPKDQQPKQEQQDQQQKQ
jgi:predicted metalloprotease